MARRAVQKVQVKVNEIKKSGFAPIVDAESLFYYWEVICQ